MKKRTNFVFGLFLVCVSSFAFAEEPSSKVIDLGEMAVQGELRRPAIHWIDSQKVVREQLPDLFTSEFDAFESKLLEEEQAHVQSKK